MMNETDRREASFRSSPVAGVNWAIQERGPPCRLLSVAKDVLETVTIYVELD